MNVDQAQQESHERWLELIFRQLQAQQEQLTSIQKEVHQVALQDKDIETSLNNVETFLGKLGDDLTKMIADEKANTASTDKAPLLARLQIMATNLGNVDAQAVAADPGSVPPVVPPPVNQPAPASGSPAGTASAPKAS